MSYSQNIGALKILCKITFRLLLHKGVHETYLNFYLDFGSTPNLFHYIYADIPKSEKI